MQQFPFEVKSSWFDGKCNITTYRLEELLGTKLRALYQRKKGRDLYDIFIALTQKPDLDIDALLHCYRMHMNFSVEKSPTQREYILNIEAKMQDREFLGDTTALLRPDVPYDPQTAYELVKRTLIERIKNQPEPATQMVMHTAHTKKPENQANSKKRIETAIRERAILLKHKMPKVLWD